MLGLYYWILPHILSWIIRQINEGRNQASWQLETWFLCWLSLKDLQVHVCLLVAWQSLGWICPSLVCSRRTWRELPGLGHSLVLTGGAFWRDFPSRGVLALYCGHSEILINGIKSSPRFNLLLQPPWGHSWWGYTALFTASPSLQPCNNFVVFVILYPAVTSLSALSD